MQSMMLQKLKPATADMLEKLQKKAFNAHLISLVAECAAPGLLQPAPDSLSAARM